MLVFVSDSFSFSLCFPFKILQLFTVGLVRLNMDGTTMLGENGQPIESYDNIDLVSYSRAWTGLETPDKRGNQDGDNGRVDPMVVSSRMKVSASSFYVAKLKIF